MFVWPSGGVPSQGGFTQGMPCIVFTFYLEEEPLLTYMELKENMKTLKI